MPRGKRPGPSIKNPTQYEAMRDEGMSKAKAARISNAGRSAAKKGGRASDDEDMSKDQLMARARRRDISGRSSMSKSELIRALRR
jgi:hypothetical protein